MISIEEKGAASVARLSGEIDMKTSPEVRQALLACLGKSRPLVVHMGAVQYIDSSGVASLVEAFQQARKAGLGFSLAEVSQNAMRVLKLARLDRVFTIHDSLEGACA